MDEFDDIIKINFGEDIIVADPPVDDSQSLESEDEVELIRQQIAEVLKEMEVFEADAAVIKTQMTEAKSQRLEFLQAVRTQLSNFDSQVAKIERHYKDVERQVREAETRKKKLLADISHAEEAKQALKDLETARARWKDIIAEHNWLWADKAREYQMVGIEFIASGIDRDLGGIALLDQMGLGKTLQAQGAVNLIQAHPKFEDFMYRRLEMWRAEADASRGLAPTWASAVLWVCPDSIKDSTQRELAKWSDAPVVVLPGGSDGTPMMRENIARMAHQQGFTLVVGYAQLRDRGDYPVTPELFNHEWPIIVADEMQQARNENSSTFINLRKLVRNSGYFIPMSGTPVENKAIEFWVMLNLMTQNGRRKDEFPTSYQFENMYLYSSSQHFMHGAFERLMKSVQDMVLRRRKDEVGIDLPDKMREIRVVQMKGKQRELYDMMRDRLMVWLDEQKSDSVQATNFLSQLTRLRQIACLPSGVRIKNDDGSETVLNCDESAKLDEAMALIRLMMESSEKCLVFGNFNFPLYELQRRIEEENLTWTDSEGNERPVRTGAITGDIKGQDRAAIQERFNDPQDDLRVVVGNVLAMGLGLNLQGACSECIFLDLYWNPGRNEQAEDRLHRMGQKNPVNIHILHADETVDNFIAMIIEKKAGVFEAMFERAELRKALEDGLI